VPWRENSPMSEKLAFVQACLDRKKRIADVCDEFGISEKTGYKQLKRFREEGIEGLADRSHAALLHPYRISPEVRERVIALRRRYPLYGAQMLRDWLVQHEPGVRWPAASSIGELLKRANLIGRRRRHNRSEERAALDTGRTRALEPNMVWTADFKGEFRLRLKNGIGPYCYPLTVLDLHSRFLLNCTALSTTSVAATERIFVRLFPRIRASQCSPHR
jgi:transposase-like protein